MPVSAQHHVGRFGVPPEVELASRIGRKLRIVADRIETASHHDQFASEFRKLRVESNRQSKIGQWSTGIDSDLMGIFVDHADKEVGGIFI